MNGIAAFYAGNRLPDRFAHFAVINTLNSSATGLILGSLRVLYKSPRPVSLIPPLSAEEA
jgi:hypothetical protein